VAPADSGGTVLVEPAAGKRATSAGWLVSASDVCAEEARRHGYPNKPIRACTWDASTDKEIRDQIVGFHDATRHATLRNSAMPGPLTPRHKGKWRSPRRPLGLASRVLWRETDACAVPRDCLIDCCELGRTRGPRYQIADILCGQASSEVAHSHGTYLRSSTKAASSASGVSA
jgi:hypothetical protein